MSDPIQTDEKVYIKLKDDDFIEAAGLERTKHSPRKSSVEKLLEESLGTLEVSPRSSPPVSPTPHHYSNQSSDDELDCTRRNRTTSRGGTPQHLKSDEFIADAGLNRTGMVPRKSSREKLLEEQLNTADQTSHINDVSMATTTSPPMRNSPQPSRENTPQQLKSDEFIADAGLSRTGVRARKSSREKLLEEQLNTVEQTSHSDVSMATTTSPPMRNSPQPSRENTPQQLKSDEFIADAGLSRTGVRARKSSREKLLEEQLNTGEEHSNTTSHTTNHTTSTTTTSEPTKPDTTSTTTTTSEPTKPGEHNHIQSNVDRKSSNASDTSSNSSTTEETKPRRRSSVYQQKQIEAPQATRGNRIASRTQHLFAQYEKDSTGVEKKPMVNVNDDFDTDIGLGSRKASYSKATREKTKIEEVRDAKSKELEEVKKQYQMRLIEEENESKMRRKAASENAELKYTKPLGNAKTQYLSSTTTVEGNDNGDEEIYDKNGKKIERSGGKVQIVRSSNSVSNIKNKFGSIGKAGWKKQNAQSEVDASTVSSARSLFKQIEKKEEGEKTFNRPTTRKVKDPKELMEMRKKITYGSENEEIPQDGVIKKMVVIDNSELGNKKNALNLYKTLESRNDTHLPVEKPRARLLSDSEARITMDGKRTTHSSTSESSGMDDMEGGSQTEEVSGYSSTGTPCSPMSTISDDYTCLPSDPMFNKDEQFPCLPEDQMFPNDEQFQVGKIELNHDGSLISDGSLDNNNSLDNSSTNYENSSTTYDAMENIEYI